MKNKTQTIVLKVNDEIIKEMDKFYTGKKRILNPPYSVFQAQESDTVITAYTSGKVVFQGISADIDAAIWREITINKKMADPLIEKKKKEPKKDEIKIPLMVSSVGSDECGTGDYFGPIVVVAVYISKENTNYILNLEIKDSKKMTDEKIKEIVPNLVKKIPYSAIIINPKEYNQKYNTDLNMNKIKAILHNKALGNILKNNHEYKYIVVDQFVYPKKYFEYLKESSHVVKNILFLTKAEDKNLAVATASVIARYIFLKEMDQLSKDLKISIPKGAGSIVDEVGKEIIKQYGVDKLKEIAKLNFKNTEKIIN